MPAMRCALSNALSSVGLFEYGIYWALQNQKRSEGSRPPGPIIAAEITNTKHHQSHDHCCHNQQTPPPESWKGFRFACSLAADALLIYAVQPLSSTSMPANCFEPICWGLLLREQFSPPPCFTSVGKTSTIWMIPDWPQGQPRSSLRCDDRQRTLIKAGLKRSFEAVAER